MEMSAQPVPVISAPAEARREFLRLTYLHLAFAFFAFLSVESFLLRWSGAEALAAWMIRGYDWLLTLVVFAAVTAAADRLARSSASLAGQYLGLAITILAEAVIFLPLMILVQRYGEPTALRTAVAITLTLVIALTAVALLSGADFSFLRSILIIGGIAAFGAIVASIVFGFGLGLWFSVVMVAFASAAILYQTSNVMKEYRADQYVAASVALFSAVTLLFWYVLRIVGMFNQD
jgi:FtsH-binding integral membrane protein